MPATLNVFDTADLVGDETTRDELPPGPREETPVGESAEGREGRGAPKRKGARCHRWGKSGIRRRLHFAMEASEDSRNELWTCGTSLLAEVHVGLRSRRRNELWTRCSSAAGALGNAETGRVPMRTVVERIDITPATG